MFLRDNETEHAAWALEMGRGLIIHSATQRRDAAARLEDLGEQELAREWRAATAAGAAAGPTSMLRRRVMCAISGVELSPDGSLAEQFAAATALMPDPPSADEIRAALKTLDADALVYLVPGQGAGNGMAITIPVAEHARWISLPDLNSEHLAEFGWLPQAGARDLGPIPDTHASRNELEDVCDWAWNVAIGPLLTEIEPPADRPPRIVLIPGRELARVPWHAARHRIEGRLRYAVEDVEFSYTPSARAFCASAWSRDVPIDGPGLIVSDPDTADQGLPLAGAREEAAAIRSCFYPEAQLLGRVPDGSSAPDGRGSPDEVTAWLTTAPTGAMLHLACHATVPKAAGNQDTAFLLLADGQRLSAETLLDSLDASRSGELSLVVLAACSSGKSGRGYDEAFSLATAFLTRGARSVISTAWSVADTATSVLMFMFHHLLREAGLRPSEALRAAQLWMLQGGELPTSAPPSLRAADLERTSSDLAVWAAFIYFGR
jgi:CHAT domain-containing protein